MEKKLKSMVWMNELLGRLKLDGLLGLMVVINGLLLVNFTGTWVVIQDEPAADFQTILT